MLVVVVASDFSKVAGGLISQGNASGYGREK